MSVLAKMTVLTTIVIFRHILLKNNKATVKTFFSVTVPSFPTHSPFLPSGVLWYQASFFFMTVPGFSKAFYNGYMNALE